MAVRTRVVLVAVTRRMGGKEEEWKVQLTLGPDPKEDRRPETLPWSHILAYCRFRARRVTLCWGARLENPGGR